MGRHISAPIDAPASLALSHSIPPASSSTSNVIVKTNSRGVVKAPNGVCFFKARNHVLRVDLLLDIPRRY
jgi:hypothetical protein